MGCMIWLVMFGSGVSIGTAQGTMKTRQLRTRQG